jgi:predicted NBD/HSP70 family sugar kinase
VLSQLYLEGPASRLELTRTCALSSATVTNVVAELIDDGLVAEAGSVDSDGGRPRTLLAVRADLGQVAGIDIGETLIRVGLFSGTLTTIATTSYANSSARFDPGQMARLAAAGLREVTQAAGVDPQTLLGVGVGVPGAVQTHPRNLIHAPTLGWSSVPFADLLSQEIAAPLYIDNCARTLGQAEMWRGAGRGARRAVIALLGVGVGAALAIVSDSDSAAGATSMTSEWGHTVITVGGAPCRCGSHGCLEAYVGAEAILDRYRSLAPGSPLRETGIEAALAELVSGAGDRGAAAEVLGLTAEYLGIGVANLINLLSPDRVVLAGWAGAIMGSAILPGVLDGARRHALPHAYGQVSIELGLLGPEAVALGAATLPIVRLLAEGGRSEAPPA